MCILRLQCRVQSHDCGIQSFELLCVHRLDEHRSKILQTNVMIFHSRSSKTAFGIFDRIPRVVTSAALKNFHSPQPVPGSAAARSARFARSMLGSMYFLSTAGRGMESIVGKPVLNSRFKGRMERPPTARFAKIKGGLVTSTCVSQYFG